MENKTCCIIGHRNIEITEELKMRIYDYIENLIICENIKVFIFGSRSKFNSLCHEIVSLLQKKYPSIKRIGYTCKSESVILNSEKEKWEKIYAKFAGKNIYLQDVEEENKYKSWELSGKFSYIKRNQAMIDDSDICLFYYNKDYSPPQQNQSKNFIFTHQSKSGTALAYNYAQLKHKIIKNFYEKNTI